MQRSPSGLGWFLLCSPQPFSIFQCKQRTRADNILRLSLTLVYLNGIRGSALSDVVLLLLEQLPCVLLASKAAPAIRKTAGAIREGFYPTVD